MHSCYALFYPTGRLCMCPWHFLAHQQRFYSLLFFVTFGFSHTIYACLSSSIHRTPGLGLPTAAYRNRLERIGPASACCTISIRRKVVPIPTYDRGHLSYGASCLFSLCVDSRLTSFLIQTVFIGWYSALHLMLQEGAESCG